MSVHGSFATTAVPVPVLDESPVLTVKVTAVDVLVTPPLPEASLATTSQRQSSPSVKPRRGTLHTSVPAALLAENDCLLVLAPFQMRNVTDRIPSGSVTTAEKV